jgi:hypothetical protein
MVGAFGGDFCGEICGAMLHSLLGDHSLNSGVISQRKAQRAQNVAEIMKQPAEISYLQR